MKSFSLAILQSLSLISLDLTTQEVDVIWAETGQHHPPATSIDRLETIRTLPSQLGRGYRREIELYPGLELCIFNETYSDLTIHATENQHLVQFKVQLSGIEDSGDYMLINAEQSYIGGSGIQPSLTVFAPRSQPLVGVDIHIQPHLLTQFFAAPTGELPPELQPLVQGDDWQRVFSPKTTEAIRLVVQQLIDCPFLGITKQLYLQGKVFELIALQLNSVLNNENTSPSGSLKPDMISRIHQAAEILRSHLENPPNQTTLAQQVGMSDRPNLERLLSLQPDLIVGLEWEEAIYPLLSKIAPTVLDDWGGTENWRDHFNFVAEVLRKQPEAQQAWDRYYQRIEELKRALGDRYSGKTISLVFLAPGAIFSEAKGSFPDSILKDVGLQRPASQDVIVPFTQLQFSEEELNKADGDILLIGGLTKDDQDTLEKLKQKPLWQQLRAVQQNRVYVIDYMTWRGGNLLAADAVIDDLFRYLVSTP